MQYNSGVTSQREYEVPIMNNMLAHAAATPPLDSNTRLIPLTKGKFAIVDSADFDWLTQWKWCASLCDGRWYAMRKDYALGRRRGQTVYMHRFAMSAPRGIEVDHFDGNTLNNSRATNLRLATSQQNKFNTGPKSNNTSGYKGVSWNRKLQKWVAQAVINREHKYLGLHATKESAAEAYSKATASAHGVFAVSLRPPKVSH
jgi:HNH endonuclease